MKIATEILIAIVALEHLYILWMEMFSWETVGKRVFKKSLPEELFKQTKGLAANQGLYNGFLAAGLIWSFFITNLEWKENVALFFLSCVALAGIYGALSADKKIFFIQSLPAILAMVLLLMY
ncbi:MAG: hypothetical protein H6Q13_1532 [Bacteroidetes bacterium]|nr:hypothetical protein [Bacteroidota bacterium]